MSFRTHAQKVCSLYRRAARCVDAKCQNRLDYRYNVTILRSRFDSGKDITDMEKAEELLKAGEEELFSAMFIEPKEVDFHTCILERKTTPPDWILDRWHPVDQSAYPEYFKRREQRIKEYTEWWDKQYGSSSTNKMNMDNCRS